MVLRKFGLPGLVLIAATVGGTAFAQMAPPMTGPQMHARQFGSHVEGHIAFLKAELGITPAQASLWDVVATAVREDVADFARQTAQDAAKMPTRPTAVESLELRAKYTELRAKGEHRFVDAFRPLYDKLSDGQKQTADALLGRWSERR